MKPLSDFSTQIEVETSIEKTFKALNEGLSSWWGNISEADFSTNGQFTITFENGYWWTFKIEKYEPYHELVWKCIAGEPEFNKEWINHILLWKITKQDSKILIKLQQIGLTPHLHCYEVCSSTWKRFLEENLKTYLSQ